MRTPTGSCAACKQAWWWVAAGAFWSVVWAVLRLLTGTDSWFLGPVAGLGLLCSFAAMHRYGWASGHAARGRTTQDAREEQR